VNGCPQRSIWPSPDLALRGTFTNAYFGTTPAMMTRT